MILTSTHLHIVRPDEINNFQENISSEEQEFFERVQAGLDREITEPDPVIIQNLMEYSLRLKD